MISKLVCQCNKKNPLQLIEHSQLDSHSLLSGKNKKQPTLTGGPGILLACMLPSLLLSTQPSALHNLSQTDFLCQSKLVIIRWRMDGQIERYLLSTSAGKEYNYVEDHSPYCPSTQSLGQERLDLRPELASGT